MKATYPNAGAELTKTVFVIEDDEASRNAVYALFRQSDAKIRMYESAEAFLAEFHPNGPSCLLLDERLPGMNGSELLRQLARDGVQTPAVVVTAYATTPMTVDAMRHGATSVLDKPASEASLRDAVSSALESDAQRIAREQPILQARERLAKLSTSEQEVLRMVLEGTPNKQIASRLGVCVRTVESRRSKIYQASGVNSVAELVRLCVAAGVID